MGGSAAAPAVREIYEGIFGFAPPESKQPVEAALPDRRPAPKLPVIRPDGTVDR